jgi:hypothetical protein
MDSIEELEERAKAFRTIDEITWGASEELAPGIWVYRDVIPEELNVISRLEEVLNSSDNDYSYSEGFVGYRMKMPKYRDCFDFKYKKTDLEKDLSEDSLKLQKLWDDVHYRILQAVKDYCNRYNIMELRYWEAMNFIKYGPGQHFMEHHDAGYSYNCTLSAVAYPNDNYEGGELFFRLNNLKIRPQAGDLYLFPSNFMYPHQAMPVESGFKYSIVTMLDYSDKFHKPEHRVETGS